MADDKDFLIKNKLEVFNLLKCIQKSRQSISVSFESLPHHCLTLLLEVHQDAQILIFDETNPRITSKLIKNKNEAEFTLKLEKLPVIFRSELIINDKKPNMIYAHFPKEIYYPQSRRSYRLKTEFMDGIKSTIVLSSNKKIECTLIDISVNGLCLRFPHNAISQFQVSHIINDIYIELPNTEGFSLEARVQFKRFENKNANIALGLQIQNQKAVTEKVIQQFIYYS